MIEVYTDGSCLKNPSGAGAYSFIIVENRRVTFKSSVGFKSTTNNRMEMMGVIAAMKRLLVEGHKNDKVVVYSDSSYVVNGLNGWLKGFKKRDWKTKDGKKVLNRDLWEELDGLMVKFSKIGVIHIRGHVGIEFNEMCDELAWNTARDFANVVDSGYIVSS